MVGHVPFAGRRAPVPLILDTTVEAGSAGDDGDEEMNGESGT